MAQTNLHGYPATLGGKAVRVAYQNGPASYVTGQGLTITDRAFRSLDYVNASITVSGLYEVEPQPVSIGNGQTWYLRFFVVATGIEVAAGTNLSAEVVQYMIIGS